MYASYTYTCTHICVHTHMHILVCIHTCKFLCTYIYPSRYKKNIFKKNQETGNLWCMPVCIHTYMYVYIQTCTYTHTHVCGKQKKVSTHSRRAAVALPTATPNLMPLCKNTCICTYTNTSMCTYTHACVIHTCVCICIEANLICENLQSCKYVHTYIHT